MARNWQSLNEYVLFCRGRLANPYPLYHQLRSEDPVHWSQQANSWILTRYDDVRFALQHDPRLTAERLSLLLAQLPREVQAEVEPLRRLLSTWMQHYEPFAKFGVGHEMGAECSCKITPSKGICTWLAMGFPLGARASRPHTCQGAAPASVGG